MSRLAEIETHIGGMAELLELVGALRSLSGMRLQEAQRTLPGIRGYAETIEAAIAGTLLFAGYADASTGAGRGKTALVLCTSEHGFVGGFNERLLDAALAALGPGDLLFAMGSRGAATAQERGRAADWRHPMASRGAAVPETIHPLSQTLYRHLADGKIGRVELMFTRIAQAGASTIERVSLLPVDLRTLGGRRPSQPPLHNLEPAVLREKLIAEYVFALLTEAAVESIAAENAARFAAMASAHDNIAAKLDGLRRDARLARQEEITTELLDVVTGSEAMAGRT